MSLQTAFVSPAALVARSGASALSASNCRLTGRPRPVTRTSGGTTVRRHFIVACDKPQSTDRPEQSDSNSSSSSGGGDGGGSGGGEEEGATHDIPQSRIDWNKSWSEFQAAGAKTMAPEGREPVSKEELARQRTSNRVRDMSNRLPSRQQLFADWRFWVAIVLTLSLFSAFVQSTAAPSGSFGTV